MPEYKLSMVFGNSADKTSTITLSNVDPEVTQAQAVALMDLIISTDIFMPQTEHLLSKNDCKLIATTVDDFYDKA